MKAPGTIDAQKAFRALLRAASRPGEVCQLPGAAADCGEEVLLALLDQEVSFRVRSDRDPASAASMESRLAVATGASPAPAAEADFALFHGGGSGGKVLSLKRGTLEAPERGATAVYAVRGFAGSEALTLTLSGPGVPGERDLVVAGLSVQEVEDLRTSRAGYPAGVDVYLVDSEGRLAGLPRSTRMEVRR